MKFSKLTHKYLDKYRYKISYLIQHKIMCCVILLMLLFLVADNRGYITRGGLNLTGYIKSTAPHQHCQYDNSFVTKGEKVDGVYGPNSGGSLEACNVRATGGAIVGNYFISEGVMYIGGPISWGHVVYELDEDGDSTYPWGMFQLTEDGISISPMNGGLQIMGSFIDKSGLTGISDKEIDRIKKELYLNTTGLVVCGEIE